MADFEQMRKDYPVFQYLQYQTEPTEAGMRIRYTFIQKKRSPDGVADFRTFTPTWDIPFSYTVYQNNEHKEWIEKTIFFLGCIELISYWKCCCSPTVEILCGMISDYANGWLKKLFFNGLGEFFYRNQIHTTIDQFMQICSVPQTQQKTTIEDNEKTTSSSKDFSTTKQVQARGISEEKLINSFTSETRDSSYGQAHNSNSPFSGYLIPVGGGKDSVVTMELMRPHHDQSDCFVINLTGAPVQTAHAAGFSDHNICRFQRNLDLQIIQMNKDGFFNGHTPFSAIVAFSAYLCALFKKKKYIVLSNESSANDTYVKGTTINHQYSKSLEFENDFRQFCNRELTSQIEYFSLLRPLNEWNIVKIFTQYPRYLDIFKSCNLGSKQNIWCAKCSKCLFTYIMLAPFVAEEQLIAVFGKNLLNDEEMIQFFDGLVCDQFDKPFECIGTRDEINTALTKTIDRYETEQKELPLLLQIYKHSYYDPYFDMSGVEHYFDPDNNVPAFLKEELQWDSNKI